ncbi:hypothetical protein FNH22_19625 [Fulvivirga sp. M361]|uniref:hypothetical protein n=1 Tax=Fulvivirga sp. M361 TaxID=2594266 RepID=UPI00117A9EBA|nr:hypothetical protein [Fulvivirga sp. M361]TRX54328.1 hypothetical protein FNH22_19625 [Fulvivirga sp. M361]
MKKQLYKANRFLLYVLPLLGVLSFVSCDDDDIKVDQQPGEFAMITSTLNADGQNRAFFLQRVSVDSTGSISNSNATELSPATGAMVHSFNGSIFFSDYAIGQMVKWDLDESNRAIKAGELSLTELVFQGNTAFKDNNTAFVGGLNTSIVIFDPTTMIKTGTIDFSAVSKIGESTDYPTEGGVYKGEAVSEIIIRDNFLFAALMPVSNIENFVPAEIGCSIIVVDLDKIDANTVGNQSAVVKRIYDERGSSTGAWGSGGGNSFMQLDENNDIYMLCHNFWANPFLRPGFKPACILKITNGETDFDQDYYFDVEDASRGTGNGVMNFEYYGNGKFLAAVQDPQAIDPENPFSYFVDPIFQWWSFDLKNKTASVVTEEYTRGALAAVSYFENGFGYVPFESNGENFVMKVDLDKLSATKQFETVGLPQLYSLD